MMSLACRSQSWCWARLLLLYGLGDSEREVENFVCKRVLSARVCAHILLANALAISTPTLVPTPDLPRPPKGVREPPDPAAQRGQAPGGEERRGLLQGAALGDCRGEGSVGRGLDGRALD